jgi:hypothetical protein
MNLSLNYSFRLPTVCIETYFTLNLGRDLKEEVRENSCTLLNVDWTHYQLSKSPTFVPNISQALGLVI